MTIKVLMSNNLNIKMLWLTMSLLIPKTHLQRPREEKTSKNEEKKMNNKFTPLIYCFGSLNSFSRARGKKDLPGKSLGNFSIELKAHIKIYQLKSKRERKQRRHTIDDIKSDQQWRRVGGRATVVTRIPLIYIIYYE